MATAASPASRAARSPCSRSSKPLSFPNIEDALAELVDGVVDGEIVAVLDGEGRSSFAVL